MQNFVNRSPRDINMPSSVDAGGGFIADLTTGRIRKWSKIKCVPRLTCKRWLNGTCMIICLWQWLIVLEYKLYVNRSFDYARLIVRTYIVQYVQINGPLKKKEQTISICFKKIKRTAVSQCLDHASVENFNAFLIHIPRYLTLAVRVKSSLEIRTEFLEFSIGMAFQRWRSYEVASSKRSKKNLSRALKVN